MQSSQLGRPGGVLLCALLLGGCIEGPVEQGPSAGLGYTGDTGSLSAAAPQLNAALIDPPLPATRAPEQVGVVAQTPDDAEISTLTAYAPTVPEPARQSRLATVPLPVTRPFNVFAGTALNIPAAGKTIRAVVTADQPSATSAGSPLPMIAAQTLIGSDPATTRAPAPKVQLASLFIEGARHLLPTSEALDQGGLMEKQTEEVVTSCFPASLKDVLADISQHFGSPVLVTSGYRTAAHNRRAGGAGHSYHVQCLAADVQIAGIAPNDIARYARTLDAVGGVGRYGHTKSVHVDVGERKFSWYGLHRRRHRSA